MAKHSVNVLIKARDEASKKFLRIGSAGKVMGRMLKSVGGGIKTVFVTALKAAKYAVISLGVALAAFTWKTLKQEAAEVELASALKVTDQYSEEAMHKLKAQAAAMQDVTTYGDEYIMTLQRMAITLGVVEGEATNAAKAAIALHAGFGGGRGKPEIFLRYYIDALRGTGTSLASYVGELRKAKTEQEKMLILQKAMAKGWDVAKSKAESAGGALSQMKNKLGDIAEVIASPLLPMIKSSAKAVTAWAKENEANIAWWAQKTFSYVTLVKDVFRDFVLFMKQDWRAGLSFAFGSFLELLKATFKSAVILAIAGGRGIWMGVKEGLLGGKESAVHERMTEIAKEQGGMGFPVTPGGAILLRGLPEEQETLRREAEKQIAEEQTKKILGGTLDAATSTFKLAIDNIFRDMPDDLRKGYDESRQKYLKRLKELGLPPGKTKPGELAAVGAPKPFSMAMAEMMKEAGSALARKLAPLESRFLTFKPGVTFDYERQQVTLLGQTAQNTKMLITSMKQLIEENKGIKNVINRLYQWMLGRPQLGTTNF